MMKKISSNVLVISFLQAMGAGLVILVWSWVMTKGEGWMSMGSDSTNMMALMLIMPLIFIITATLSGGAVLGYPLYLAFQKNWTKAAIIVLLTLVWLAIFSTLLIYIF